MNLKDTNKLFFSQAKALKMCDDVHKLWYGKTLSYDELFSLFYQNLDFCIEHRWPSEEDLSQRIPAEDRRKNGLLVNDRWSLLNTTHAAIIGNSVAKARYNGFAVGKIYVFNDAICDIAVKGHASVMIHVYDSAKVSVSAQEGTHVLILRHSDDCICNCAGRATIKECI